MEKTVTALRHKDALLQQLLLGKRRPQSCAFCLPTVDATIAENSLLLDDNERKDQENALEMFANLEQESVQLSQRLKREKQEQQHQDDGIVVSIPSICEGDAGSEVTLVMGQCQQSISSRPDFDDDQSKKESEGKMDARRKETVEEPSSGSATLAERESKLHQTRKKLVEANESIVALQDEKVALEEDFEETLREREERIKHLKGHLCC